MKSCEKAFYKGVAVGVATLGRRGEDSLAWDIMQSNGISFRDFEVAGVDEFDMKAIRGVIPERYLPRRQRSRKEGAK